MSVLRRKFHILIALAMALSLTVFLSVDRQTVLAGKPPIVPPPNMHLTTATTTLSENPAIPGDIVDITANVTIAATGNPVPNTPGNLAIQWCLDLGTGEGMPAANCNGPSPTAVWDDVANGAPPLLVTPFDTTNWAGHTIGFRGLYQPRGSGYAGAAGTPVDLVISANTPTPTATPSPTPTNTPSGDLAIDAIYRGTITTCASTGCSPPSNLDVWVRIGGGEGFVCFSPSASSCPLSMFFVAVDDPTTGAFHSTGLWNCYANCPEIQGNVSTGSLTFQLLGIDPSVTTSYTGSYLEPGPA